MGQDITRGYVARVEDVNPRDRSMVSTINTAALDRYRTVIDPRGINTRNYLENRVVLWEHGRDPRRGMMPVGRCDWVRSVTTPDGPALRARTLFYSGKKADDFTERLFECYRDGDMRAWSVNVVPDAGACGPPTRDEIAARPDLVDCWMMYRSSDLAEYSAVAVGGNADALTSDEGRSILKCVSRGLHLPSDLVARAEEAAEAEEQIEGRHVVKEDGKYYVLSKDRKKRLGGPYDTKEEADKRLGQIEYFKEHGRAYRDAPVHKDPNAGPNSYKKNIKEVDGKFEVYDDEGKHMGTYDTRKEAEKRVEQIVWFKDHDENRSEDDVPDDEQEYGRSLPPLGGRPYAERRAELLGQFRSMLDEAAARFREETDWHRGRV